MAAAPNKEWGWWGEEGGYQLRVERLGNGVIKFTVWNGEREMAVSLASFRVTQLQDWLNQPELAGEE